MIELIIVCIFGLLVGSFLNAAEYRVKNSISLGFERSKCVHCKHLLGPRDLIPLLSYCCLMGKCRYCQKKISFQYPIVEFMTALLFGIVYLHHFDSSNHLLLAPVFSIKNFIFFRDIVVVSILVFIFIYDLKYFLILDIITLPTILFLFVVNLLLGYSYIDLLLGFFVGSLFFFSQYYISGGKWIGGGDIRMGALMGVLLGWKLLLVALMIAYMLGSFVGIMLIIIKKKELGSKVAFGTFLSIGTFISMIWGYDILNWYLTLSY